MHLPYPLDSLDPVGYLDLVTGSNQLVIFDLIVPLHPLHLVPVTSDLVDLLNLAVGNVVSYH